MQRKIIGFHKDEEGFWVAELECLHNQHVRHRPPFFNREWTLTEKGRNSKLGTKLYCKKCENGEDKDREK